ncbi:MAG TPA: NHL repeat-containing protein [Gemmataceae bacterium]|nr:NHL repeat-containing protein [Gemmataceae bacterium]
MATRCAAADAQFTGIPGGNAGPAGITIDARGRLFVTDHAGLRVLSWPDAAVVGDSACQKADELIPDLFGGPEAVVFDEINSTLFIADTGDHTVKGFRRDATGAWKLQVTLGKSGTQGSTDDRFNFPRGLAVDADGRLFVADDDNSRVLIFASDAADGASCVDKISAGNNGGFIRPKGIAFADNTLYVADYGDEFASERRGRVLRFPGPFDDPAKVYTADGILKGGPIKHPIDLCIDGAGGILITVHGDDTIPRSLQRFPDAKTSVWREDVDAVDSPVPEIQPEIHTEPLGVAAGGSGRIFLCDYRAFRILVRTEPLPLRVKQDDTTCNS